MRRNFSHCEFGATVASLGNPSKGNLKLDHTTHLNVSSIHTLPFSSLLTFKSSIIKVNKPVLKRCQFKPHLWWRVL